MAPKWRSATGAGGGAAVTLREQRVWRGSRIWRPPRAAFRTTQGLHIGNDAHTTLRQLQADGCSSRETSRWLLVCGT